MAFDPLFVKICCACKRYQDPKDTELSKKLAFVTQDKSPVYIIDVLHLQKVSGNVYYPFGIYGKPSFHNSS